MKYHASQNMTLYTIRTISITPLGLGDTTEVILTFHEKGVGRFRQTFNSLKEAAEVVLRLRNTASWEKTNPELFI